MSRPNKLRSVTELLNSPTIDPAELVTRLEPYDNLDSEVLHGNGDGPEQEDLIEAACNRIMRIVSEADNDAATEMALIKSILHLLPPSVGPRSAAAIWSHGLPQMLSQVFEALSSSSEQLHVLAAQQLLLAVLQAVQDVAEARYRLPLPPEMAGTRARGKSSRDALGELFVRLLLEFIPPSRYYSLPLRRAAASTLLDLATSSRANQQAVADPGAEPLLRELLDLLPYMADYGVQLDLVEVLFRVSRAVTPDLPGQYLSGEAAAAMEGAVEAYTAAHAAKKADEVDFVELLRPVVMAINAAAGARATVYSYEVSSCAVQGVPGVKMAEGDPWVHVALSSVEQGGGHLAISLVVPDAEDEAEPPPDTVTIFYDELATVAVRDAPPLPGDVPACELEVRLAALPEALQRAVGVGDNGSNPEAAADGAGGAGPGRHHAVSLVLLLRRVDARAMLGHFPKRCRERTFVIQSQDPHLAELSQPASQHLPGGRSFHKMSRGLSIYPAAAALPNGPANAPAPSGATTAVTAGGENAVHGGAAAGNAGPAPAPAPPVPRFAENNGAGAATAAAAAAGGVGPDEDHAQHSGSNSVRTATPLSSSKRRHRRRNSLAADSEGEEAEGQPPPPPLAPPQPQQDKRGPATTAAPPPTQQAPPPPAQQGQPDGDQERPPQPPSAEETEPEPERLPKQRRTGGAGAEPDDAAAASKAKNTAAAPMAEEAAPAAAGDGGKGGVSQRPQRSARAGGGKGGAPAAAAAGSQERAGKAGGATQAGTGAPGGAPSPPKGREGRSKAAGGGTGSQAPQDGGGPPPPAKEAGGKKGAKGSQQAVDGAGKAGGKAPSSKIKRGTQKPEGDAAHVPLAAVQPTTAPPAAPADGDGSGGGGSKKRPANTAAVAVPERDPYRMDDGAGEEGDGDGARGAPPGKKPRVAAAAAEPEAAKGPTKEAAQPAAGGAPSKARVKEQQQQRMPRASPPPASVITGHTTETKTFRSRKTPPPSTLLATTGAPSVVQHGPAATAVTTAAESMPPPRPVAADGGAGGRKRPAVAVTQSQPPSALNAAAAPPRGAPAPLEALGAPGDQAVAKAGAAPAPAPSSRASRPPPGPAGAASPIIKHSLDPIEDPDTPADAAAAEARRPPQRHERGGPEAAAAGGRVPGAGGRHAMAAAEPEPLGVPLSAAMAAAAAQNDEYDMMDEDAITGYDGTAAGMADDTAASPLLKPTAPAPPPAPKPQAAKAPVTAPAAAPPAAAAKGKPPPAGAAAKRPRPQPDTAAAEAPPAKQAKKGGRKELEVVAEPPPPPKPAPVAGARPSRQAKAKALEAMTDQLAPSPNKQKQKEKSQKQAKPGAAPAAATAAAAASGPAAALAQRPVAAPPPPVPLPPQRRAQVQVRDVVPPTQDEDLMVPATDDLVPDSIDVGRVPATEDDQLEDAHAGGPADGGAAARVAAGLRGLFAQTGGGGGGGRRRRTSANADYEGDEGPAGVQDAMLQFLAAQAAGGGSEGDEEEGGGDGAEFQALMATVMQKSRRQATQRAQKVLQEAQQLLERQVQEAEAAVNRDINAFGKAARRHLAAAQAALADKFSRIEALEARHRAELSATWQDYNDTYTQVEANKQALDAQLEQLRREKRRKMAETHQGLEAHVAAAAARAEEVQRSASKAATKRLAHIFTMMQSQ
ncbi:hypothetical protein GPECTOR_71g574 [Gonium pectorale]|uniref:Uncharacterized protein n=1 Tax=Gonium pectorale TaxID=33097 RepID=A0A150G321_GONPE|nr:hypothetical protein GPECTOR_71g574 [Gonium pectorale]|eukprot:KXZ44213.1 hypothetical protein GPECTOR_71g574 [Gonium pectorale]